MQKRPLNSAVENSLVFARENRAGEKLRIDIISLLALSPRERPNVPRLSPDEYEHAYCSPHTPPIRYQPVICYYIIEHSFNYHGKTQNMSY